MLNAMRITGPLGRRTTIPNNSCMKTNMGGSSNGPRRFTSEHSSRTLLPPKLNNEIDEPLHARKVHGV